MLNLSYRFDQNSCSLRIDGIPDLSKGDSVNTIGILSIWKLQIIGCPILEGKKDHLEYLMQVVLKYSRYCVSGIRKTFKSNDNIVVISPFNEKHKLSLTSTQKNTKPLEIILDDSELSDLTRCLDLFRFDDRININFSIEKDYPLKERYILKIKDRNRIKNILPSFYGLFIFIITSSLFLLIPTGNYEEMINEPSNVIIPTKKNK